MISTESLTYIALNICSSLIINVVLLALSRFLIIGVLTITFLHLGLHYLVYFLYFSLKDAQEEFEGDLFAISSSSNDHTGVPSDKV